MEGFHRKKSNNAFVNAVAKLGAEDQSVRTVDVAIVLSPSNNSAVPPRRCFPPDASISRMTALRYLANCFSSFASRHRLSIRDRITTHRSEQHRQLRRLWRMSCRKLAILTTSLSIAMSRNTWQLASQISRLDGAALSLL